MQDSRCDVVVGIHPSPFWIDKNSGLKVCNRHKEQYDEIEEIDKPFAWEKQHVASAMDLSALIEED